VGRPRVTTRIVVVGDIATDVVARLSGPLRTGSDSSAVVATYGGGSAANVAAWLAVAGVPTTFVGRAGADAAGRAQVDELARAGVDVRVAVDDDRATGCVVVLVAGDGERTMLPDRGANAALCPADLPADVFAGDSGHLHLSGYPLLHESSRAGGLAALELAGAAHMTVSVDPSSAAPLAAAGPAQFLEWTHAADICLLNLDEAEVLAGPGPPEALARRLSDEHYREVVVKLGAAGALWASDGVVVSVPAAPASVIDTTGAGDAFAAGFLSAWQVAGPPDEALMAGGRLAAACVAQVGARPRSDVSSALLNGRGR